MEDAEADEYVPPGTPSPVPTTRELRSATRQARKGGRGTVGPPTVSTALLLLPSSLIRLLA